MSNIPQKSMGSITRISDIDGAIEMLELFKLLQINYKGRKLDLEDMKEQAKEKIQEQISSSKGATVDMHIFLFNLSTMSFIQ